MSFPLELPEVVIDGVGEVASSVDLLAVNRDPAPAEVDVPLAASVGVTILATGAGATVNLASIVVTIGGVTAYTGGAFQPGFSGSVVAAAGNRVDVVVQPAVPFVSLAVVPVTVAATASAGGPLAASWSFTVLDVTSPVLTGAVARSLRIVRASWGEPVLQASPSGGGDALNPDNWTLAAGNRPEWLPLVFPVAKSARSVSSTAVDIEFVDDLSPGAPYRLVAGPVQDLHGNPCAGPTNVVSFVAAAPPVPAGRAFDLYMMLPALNRREDAAGTLDLRRFTAVLQDPTTLLLGDLDAFPDVLDPDYAPEGFVDAMLADLGNPFRFDLDLPTKRLLVLALVQLYKEKGTERGILAAVLFFLGIVVTITDYVGDTLTLGESELGVDWSLGPAGSFALYAFDVHSPVALSDAQRTQLVALVQYMKPAHTHFVNLIEPAAVEVIDHWQLGKSELATETILH